MEELARAGAASVSVWANGPGDTYSTHTHPYRKVLCCLHGSVVFHLAGRDVQLEAGDRMEIGPGVPHAASVGPLGVRCAEAHFGGSDRPS